MVGRIKAAVDARVDENFLLIARTDAPSITSMEDTIDRCNQYIEAGADVTMAIGHMKREDIIRIGAEVKGWKYGVLTGSGIAPAISLFDLEKMGYQAAGMPLQLLMRQLWVARKMLEDLKTKGTIEHLRPEMVSFDQLTQFQNLKKYQEMEYKYD
jgi:2-methylisocitrate lyase-like PEP mutase family enzyme